jgi:hypothetical protein
VSDRAQAEFAGKAAFAELETVVHHITEQLTGFRRRALAAESRVRELEQALASAQAELQALTVAARRAAVAKAPQATPVAGALDPVLVAENQALRTRLAQATEQARRLTDGVRFLRQQMTAGADK